MDEELQEGLVAIVKDQVKRREENEILRQAAKILMNRKDQTADIRFRQRNYVRVKITAEFYLP